MKMFQQLPQTTIQLRHRRKSIQSCIHAFLLVVIFIIICSSLSSATIRYVSKTGSSTPPYTSWETAADSIQKCINISGFGDTIYVANGVYKEQVVMIPGLSLIGAGMDSCVIDTRGLIQPGQNTSVVIGDSSLIKGFNIVVHSDTDEGYGISSSKSCYITNLKIENAKFGIYNGYTGSLPSIIDNNIIKNISIGIEAFNSSSIIKNNYISTDRNSQSAVITGIRIEAFTYEYYPIVDSNYIIANRWDGIIVSFGTRSTIKNNIIILKEDGDGIGIITTGDFSKIYNNLIFAEDEAFNGFQIAGTPYLFLFNNTIMGNYRSIAGAIYIGSQNTVINNSILKTNKLGYVTDTTNLKLKYNNLWDYESGFTGYIPDSTNISAHPMFVDEDSLDFHLQMFSPLIDAGDPNILDKDGSRSDIGLFGGPYGEKYTYRDLAPKPPSNLTAQYDSGLVKLTWNRNTEADFFHYRVYRDTVPDFMYDTTKIIAVIPDTVFYDNLPEIYLPGNYYYKVTALDSTGHQSAPSEEIHVNITGVPEGPPVVVEHYQLLNNYPNPFNSSTIIPYRLKEGGHVKLVVYTTLGEEVAILVDHYQPKGYYEAEFNPTKYQRRKGSFGKGLSFPTGYNDDIATGIYIYRLIVSDSYWETKFVASGKMILLR